MTLVEALILGFVQGLTEFLPVSSSGHLVLSEILLGVELPPLELQAMNILLHAATLLALLICYWRTWWLMARSLVVPDIEHRRLLALLIIATVPAGIIGVLFEEVIAEMFHGITPVAIALLGTAAVLTVGERVQSTPRQSLTPMAAMLVGFAQACALVPGFSRAGFTISAARMLGLSRKQALDFSFLMAVPIFMGATILSLQDIVSGTLNFPSLAVVMSGVVMSFISSVLAIIWLRKFVIGSSFLWFVPYLVVASFSLLIAEKFFLNS